MKDERWRNRKVAARRQYPRLAIQTFRKALAIATHRIAVWMTHKKNRIKESEMHGDTPHLGRAPVHTPEELRVRLLYRLSSFHPMFS